VKDNVTLPIQRLRESRKRTDQIERGQGHRAGNWWNATAVWPELRDEVKAFLEQSAPEHVYWVERSGKAHKNLALNAAPIDVADFLRPPFVRKRHSIIMTSATLAVSAKVEGPRVEGREPEKALVPRPSSLDVAAELFCKTCWEPRRRLFCRSARRSIMSGR